MHICYKLLIVKTIVIFNKNIFFLYKCQKLFVIKNIMCNFVW